MKQVEAEGVGDAMKDFRRQQDKIENSPSAVRKDGLKKIWMGILCILITIGFFTIGVWLGFSPKVGAWGMLVLAVGFLLGVVGLVKLVIGRRWLALSLWVRIGLIVGIPTLAVGSLICLDYLLGPK